MRTMVPVIAAIVSLLIAAGTAFQLYLLLWRPEIASVSQQEIQKWSLWRKAIFYGSMAAAFIGVGYMIYKGVEGALWFIPKSWTRLDEDGEPEWVAHGIAMLIAFFGSIIFFARLYEIAAERAREFWSRPPSQRV